MERQRLVADFRAWDAGLPPALRSLPPEPAAANVVGPAPGMTWQRRLPGGHHQDAAPRAPSTSPRPRRASTG